MGLDLKVPRAHVLSGGGMVSSVIHRLEKLVPQEVGNPPLFYYKAQDLCSTQKDSTFAIAILCVGAGKKEFEKIAEGQRSPPESERCWSGPQPGRPIIFCVLSPVAGEPWPWRPLSAVFLAASGSLGKPLGIKWEVGPSSL